MRVSTNLRRRIRSRLAGAALTALCGLLLWESRVSEGLSFDLPFAFGPHVPCDDILIIRLDEQSYDALELKWRERFDRGLHARLLNKLKDGQSGLVVFDVFFPSAESEPGDSQLAQAIRAHGRVVLPADLDALALPGLVGRHVMKPWTNFLYAAGTNWGLSAGLGMDADLAVRRHSYEPDLGPSLAWAAATLAGAPITKYQTNEANARWIHYYGTNGTLPDLSFYRALEKAPEYFRGKTVFIGGKPHTRFPGELVDEFRTPYTRLQAGEKMQGVDIEATMFLNLMRGDWLSRMSSRQERWMIVLAGLLLGYGLAQVRPMLAASLALLAFFLVAIAAITLVWQTHLWFSWMTIAGMEIPCAFIWSVLTYTKILAHEKEVLEIKLASSLAGSQRQLTRPTMTPDGTRLAPFVPDYKLLRSIGHGAYGEVWLAVNTIGLYHAIKIVDKTHFDSDEPYTREFKGMERYMPISLKHPGLVHMLHVGRNEESGYFYYVMEIGDDERTRNKIIPESYSPRNLAKDLEKGRLPVAECISLGLTLTDALEFLHQQQLIHRDIKPSNIIFIDGVPKLADIGLVTSINTERQKKMTFVGTRGFIAPEGPTSPAADVYSIGKMLYEAATGLDRLRFPQLPDPIDLADETVAFMRLNTIIVKACEHNLQTRYSSAAELRAALLDLKRQTPTPE